MSLSNICSIEQEACSACQDHLPVTPTQHHRPPEKHMFKQTRAHQSGPRTRLASSLALLGLLIVSACAGTSSDQQSLEPAVTAQETASTASIATPTSIKPSTTQASTTETPSPSSEPAEPPPDTEPCPSTAKPKPGIDYQVVDVADDDVLNIRQFPGHRTKKVGALGPNTSGIRPTGQCAMVGAGAWWELDTGNDGSWVNSKFLAPG